MRLTVTEKTKYLTVPRVAKLLGMDRKTVVKHLEKGVLPPPTKRRADGVRLFDREWLNLARKMRQRYLNAELPLKSTKGGDSPQ